MAGSLFLVLLAAGAGGAAAAAAMPSPTCALNGLPCAPPTWAPTWNLTQSTVIQPSGDSYFIPKHPWGLISLDWSVARSIWFRGNTSNTTCEATSRRGCAMLKAAGLATRCFIYHNQELGLEWLETQRAVMASNPEYFLRYLPGNTGNKPVGDVYNEPRAEGNQFFWNHSNQDAAQYFMASVLSSLEADGGVADGTFTDDVDGVPAEHPNAQKNVGMSDDALAALRFATQSTSSALIQALTLAGKYNWQAPAFRACAPPPTSCDCVNCTDLRSLLVFYCLPRTRRRHMRSPRLPPRDEHLVRAEALRAPALAQVARARRLRIRLLRAELELEQARLRDHGAVVDAVCGGGGVRAREGSGRTQARAGARRRAVAYSQRWSMPCTRAPRAAHICAIICCRRSLQPTPPTMSTSSRPACAMARSVISTSMAKTVSCSEKHRSATVASPEASLRGAARAGGQADWARRACE